MYELYLSWDKSNLNFLLKEIYFSIYAIYLNNYLIPL